jgi:hypothetical protein
VRNVCDCECGLRAPQGDAREVLREAPPGARAMLLLYGAALLVLQPVAGCNEVEDAAVRQTRYCSSMVS